MWDGHMWGGHMGWGGMGLAWLLLIVLVCVVVWVTAYAARRSGNARSSRHSGQLTARLLALGAAQLTV